MSALCGVDVAAVDVINVVVVVSPKKFDMTGCVSIFRGGIILAVDAIIVSSEVDVVKCCPEA